MPTCFVIKPMSPVYDDIYVKTLAPAIRRAGLEPTKGGEHPLHQQNIRSWIDREIEQSSVCVADISLDNPNIWLELGYAAARGKQLILICGKERRNLPFDVQLHNVIFYGNGPSDYDALAEHVEKALRELPVASPVPPVSPLPTPAAYQASSLGQLTPEGEQLLMTIWRLGFGEPRKALESSIRERFERLNLDQLVLEELADALYHRGWIGKMYLNESPAYALTERSRAWIRANVANWRTDR